MITVLTTDRGASRSTVVPDRQIAQLDGASLGLVANDVGLARYRLGGQRRAWLSQQDLEGGITGGDILRLPPLFPGTLEREFDVAPFDTSKWTSVRVSDVGYCSVEVGWARVDLLAERLGLPRGGFATLLTDAVDGAVIGSSNIRGGRRVPMTMARVQPVFRSERVGRRLLAHDTVRFAADYQADLMSDNGVTFGTPVTCNNVTIHVDFEFSLERADTALISVAPHCTGPGSPGGTLAVDADPAFDHLAVVEAVNVDVSDACAYEGIFEETAEAGLRGSLPELFGRVIRDAGVIDPRIAGIDEADIRTCTCDSDCNRFSPQGAAFDPAVVPRPRCRFPSGVPPQPNGGECWIQLEFDRVEFTPQGVEVVVSESDADVQQSLVDGLIEAAGGDFVRTLLCGPDRRWVGPDVDVVEEADELLRTLPFPILRP
ncbi:MAG: hypothetical protein K1X94_30715 [Sandaracinaceae bacterium]|nr:hypothetical protein [Sandaracinaceae bacterium]